MKHVAVYFVVMVSLCSVVNAQQAAARGTAEGAVGGRKVTVEYGRAELKGRSIDSLIAKLPADRVWRTGANELTTLTTEGPLSVGGKNVPAGTYSVYVYAPATGDWSLILNSDLGIELGALGKFLGVSFTGAEAKRLWPHNEGYMPDPAKKIPGIADKEVARGSMKAGTANPAVDLFTINLKPSGNGANLTFAWGEKTWSADLKPGK
jgi:hypothetical protein